MRTQVVEGVTLLSFFAKLSFLRKKHSRGCYSTEFFAKLFSKASIKPRQRSGATVHFLCQAFFFAKESGLPVTPQSHWVLPLSYCACAPGASAFGTLSGRSRLIARPPLILATFVASALLAWKCSQSTFACGLRARRQPPRTRALNVPRRASTNIGNRAFQKK